MTRPRVTATQAVVAAGVIALCVLAYFGGSLAGAQRDLIVTLEANAQAREAEVEALHADIARLQEEIREEIRTPVGERAEMAIAAREAIETIARLEAKIDALAEIECVRIGHAEWRCAPLSIDLESPEE